MKISFENINQIMLFGGGYGVLQSIEITKELNFNPVVVTSPRHAETVLSNQKTFLENLQQENVETIITESLNDDQLQEKITKTTLALSFGAAWIFPKLFIERFEDRLINYHAAPLPRHRGGGGYSWRIMNNDRQGNCLLHIIDTGIDTGDVIKYKEFIYPMHCRFPADFMAYTLELSAFFLREFFTDVKDGISFNRSSQVEYLSSYYPRLNTEVHGFVDWGWDHQDIVQFICAFDEPYKGASTFYHDQQIRIKDAYTYEGDGFFHPFVSGMVYRKNADAVYIAANKGSVIAKRILNEDGEDISSTIKVGHRFYTPMSYLDKAKEFYAVYTPIGLKK
jgi:methionyl-tRNA formyltransferase